MSSDVWGRARLPDHVNCGRGHMIPERIVRYRVDGSVKCWECDNLARVITSILDGGTDDVQ